MKKGIKSLNKALKALKQLHAGNYRFVSDSRQNSPAVNSKRRAELVQGQKPFAVILGCSDSRVSPEIVFDQTLGDLFIIRVAGNIVTPVVMGSVEFAVEQFDTRLVVVLGHTRCGAVMATLEELYLPAEDCSPNLGSIISHIRPSLEDLVETELRKNPDALMKHAVHANILASVEQLKNGSQLLGRLVRDDGLLIGGAQYSLETGKVNFFDGPAG
ncbi:MAG: carbonic anhydrase [Calditrichaeota bacterium]|nr:carbonic anhydrase [Calditrichota bacterium]RQW06564.1 MAG: carbonic anhydrase [Calditrichota bacterium]